MTIAFETQPSGGFMPDQPYLPAPNFTATIHDDGDTYQVQFDIDCWTCTCESFRNIGDCKHIDKISTQIRQQRITQISQKLVKPIAKIKNGSNPFVERNITCWRTSQTNFGSTPPKQNGQEPHTLWIGCADSRVPPEMIIGAQPGELFIHRNIGNMVPLPGPANDCTTALLNYGLSHLSSIQNIVICGHTDCGAMKAMEDLSCGTLEPHLARWLAQAEPIVELVSYSSNGSKYIQELAEANVIFQIYQLYQHEIVKRRLQARELTIHGMLYDIADRSLKELVRFTEQQ